MDSGTDKKRETLSKSERLCGERRIGALFAGGRRGGAGPLRFSWLVRNVPESGAGDGSADCAAVSVLFSVPKKIYKRAWKRNLMKRRMRESYRRRKHELADIAATLGRPVDIALVCIPEGSGKGNSKTGSVKVTANGASKLAGATVTKKGGAKKLPEAPLPDFKTIDEAIEKILTKIASQLRR